MCRHCQNPVEHRRGLCRRCYRTTAIRVAYPSEFEPGTRRVRDIRDAEEPEPTTALPGTPEKVAVLDQRQSAGQQLFHPKDKQIDSEEDDLDPILAAALGVLAVKRIGRHLSRKRRSEMPRNDDENSCE